MFDSLISCKDTHTSTKHPLPNNLYIYLIIFNTMSNDDDIIYTTKLSRANCSLARPRQLWRQYQKLQLKKIHHGQISSWLLIHVNGTLSKNSFKRNSTIAIWRGHKRFHTHRNVATLNTFLLHVHVYIIHRKPVQTDTSKKSAHPLRTTRKVWTDVPTSGWCLIPTAHWLWYTRWTVINSRYKAPN